MKTKRRSCETSARGPVTAADPRSVDPAQMGTQQMNLVNERAPGLHPSGSEKANGLKRHFGSRKHEH